MHNFREYYNTWVEHQVMHECTRECPSVHTFFDDYLRSQNVPVDGKLVDFLVDYPSIRISGSLREKVNFWSKYRFDGFPVSNEDPAFEYHYRNCRAGDEFAHETGFVRCRACDVVMNVSDTLTNVAERTLINQVDESATPTLENILERMETTLNNIDKHLATLVEQSKEVPVVVAVNTD